MIKMIAPGYGLLSVCNIDNKDGAFVLPRVKFETCVSLDPIDSVKLLWMDLYHLLQEPMKILQ